MTFSLPLQPEHVCFGFVFFLFFYKTHSNFPSEQRYLCLKLSHLFTKKKVVNSCYIKHSNSIKWYNFSEPEISSYMFWGFNGGQTECNGYFCRKWNQWLKIKNLEEAVFISLCINTLEKDIIWSLLLPAMNKW